MIVLALEKVPCLILSMSVAEMDLDAISAELDRTFHQ
jgi:hypothetical protein